MKNKDTILKYFSGMLEGKELEEFERRLTDSPEFREEFEEMNLNLAQLKMNADVKFDNRYFASSLARLKQKSVKKKKYPRYVPAFSLGLIAILFMFVFISAPFKDSMLFDADKLSHELYSAVDSANSDEIYYFMKHDMITHYTYYEDINADLVANISLDELEYSTQNDISAPYNYNYDMLNNASTEDIDNLYNEILETKIL